MPTYCVFEATRFKDVQKHIATTHQKDKVAYSSSVLRLHCINLIVVSCVAVFLYEIIECNHSSKLATTLSTIS